jgi:uncharacterized tellurite resistance protein B-like protein
MRLLDQVRGLLQRRAALAQDRSGAPADLELQAATAVLLIEAAYGDSEYAWSEHRAIVRGLERSFGLGRKQVLELLGRADEIRPPAVTLADVTDALRERFDLPQREAVARLVWQVVDADHVAEEWEEGFAEHVARALGLDAAQARAARGGGAGG